MVTYRPVKMRHPIAGFSYGIMGEECGEDGTVTGYVMMPDISCDYFYVSRLAVESNVKQWSAEQLFECICASENCFEI